MPTKTWATGEDVLSTDFNTYVQKQVVSTFADATARTAAIPSPTQGQLTVLLDTNHIEIWTGTAWSTVNDPPAIRARISGVQGLTAGAETQLAMNAVDYSRNGMALSTGAISVPITGLYLVVGFLGSANGGANTTLTGNFTLALAGNVYYGRHIIYASGVYPTGTVTALAAMIAGERIGFNVTASVGAFADPTNGNLAASTLSLVLVSK